MVIAIMDSLMTVAASGMRARMESLDMLANNVANANTAGFKADREFYGIYISEESAQNADALNSPVIEKHWTDYSQGVLTATGNPLDLGIAGDGFFAVDGKSGPLYTRNGNFRVGLDGQIEALDGSKLRVKTPDGRPLNLNAAKPVDVGSDGTIRQDGQDLGRIEMFSLDNTTAAVKRGSTYFQWMDGGEPKRTATAEIHQGTMESSNVPVAEAAVRLVSVMRQFEMLQRAVALGAEMNKRSIDEVARVS